LYDDDDDRNNNDHDDHGQSSKTINTNERSLIAFL